MTNIKAVDVIEIEKLPQYATFQSYDGSLTIHAEEEYIKLSDLRVLLDRSPSVSAPTIPEGYALVPIEPTDEMLRAGGYNPEISESGAKVYKAMLSAIKEK